MKNKKITKNLPKRKNLQEALRVIKHPQKFAKKGNENSLIELYLFVDGDSRRKRKGCLESHETRMVTG